MSSARLPSRRARDVSRALQAEQWELDRVTHGNHLLFVHPSGARMIVSATPSDARAHKRVMCLSRRLVREAMSG